MGIILGVLNLIGTGMELKMLSNILHTFDIVGRGPNAVVHATVGYAVSDSCVAFGTASDPRRLQMATHCCDIVSRYTILGRQLETTRGSKTV